MHAHTRTLFLSEIYNLDLAVVAGVLYLSTQEWYIDYLTIYIDNIPL